MGTISEKLVYLDGTREQIKENLNKFGSNITENDTFRSYSNVLNDIYDKLPKVSANGSDFSLENAQNGKLDSFGMDGNTEQTTYTGKNLYKWSNVTYSSDVTTVSWCFQDGTVGAYGGNITDKTIYKFELEAGTYKISGNSIDNNILTIQAVKNGSPDEIILISSNLNPSTSTATITLTEKTTLCVRYRVTNPSLGIGNTKIQIEQGSTATDYEPYVGGTPSPNPDYPQDVKVVENEQNINVHGKNLFDKNNLIANYRLGSNGLPFYQPNYSITGYIPVKPNTNYCRNINFNTNKAVCLYDSNEEFIIRITSGNSFTTTNETKYIRTSVSTDEIDDAQLEENSTATTYEPYQSKDYEINLGDIELCKIGDYKDVIFKNNQLSEYYDSTLDEDSWYIKKEIGKVVLDGSESWFTQKSTSPYVFALNYDNYKRTQENICKCNFFSSVVNGGYGDLTNGQIRFRYNSGDANKYLYVCTTVASTINGFQTWLSTHNTEVYYVLATPTYETITNETLISQLESIETFTGLNNFSVSNENNVLPTLYVSRLKELGKLE